MQWDQNTIRRLEQTIVDIGGSVDLASNTETIVGTSTVKAVSPAGLAYERPYFDVRSYGAVGDGVTDDTSAITAAMTACDIAGGGRILFPKGNYKVNSALPALTTCTTIEGGGAGIPGYIDAVTTLTFAAGVTGFTLEAHGSAVVNLLLTSLSSTLGTDDGISLRSGYCRVQDVVIDGFGRYGVNQDSTDLTNINLNHLEKVLVYRSQSHGFYTKGVNSNNAKFIGCTATENEGWGFYTDASSSCMFLAPNADRNVTGDFYDNGGSNHYYDVYSEGSGLFTAGSGSQRGMLTCGNNGMPVVSLGVGTPVLTWTVMTNCSWMRQIRVGPMPADPVQKTYKLATSTPNNGDLSLINETNNVFIYSVDSTTNLLTVAQKTLFSGEIEIDGAINHDGTTVGFYGVTPTTRPTAYTQTFATADKTHAARTATTLTDNTAGTANTTLEALTSGSVYATDVAAIRNNFADLAASDNKLIADLADTAQLLNSVIDDLQALGLLQ